MLREDDAAPDGVCVPPIGLPLERKSILTCDRRDGTCEGQPYLFRRYEEYEDTEAVEEEDVYGERDEDG